MAKYKMLMEGEDGKEYRIFVDYDDEIALIMTVDEKGYTITWEGHPDKFREALNELQGK